jgi:hypothetical protein
MFLFVILADDKREPKACARSRSVFAVVYSFASHSGDKYLREPCTQHGGGNLVRLGNRSNMALLVAPILVPPWRENL